ncbi:uncharacterized protein V6R79_005215 [Siganus canaliculatus]
MSDEKTALPTHRQCTFEFKNHSNITLWRPRVHVVSGTCEEPLTPLFRPSESGSALFKKTPHTACGSVGVLTYDLQTECGQLMEEKMAVMFSNPYDFNLHSNWFAVGFFDMSRDCNSSLFDEMYNKFLDSIPSSSHLKLLGIMSTSYQCIVYLKNQSKITLFNKSIFLKNGQCVDTLPQSLGPSGSGSGLFKSEPGAATGSSAVFSYNLEKINGEMMDEKIAVMFDNPDDCHQQNKCFAVGLFAKSRACDETLYKQMRYDRQTTFVRVKAGQPLSYDGGNLTINVTMSDDDISVIKVEVWDKSTTENPDDFLFRDVIPPRS